MHSEGPAYVDEYDDAVTILKRRYARGEITKEEYDMKMKDILQPPHGGSGGNAI